MRTPYFNLFEPQSFSYEEEQAVMRNNMTIDLYFGHSDVLESYVRDYSDYREHFDWLQTLSSDALRSQAEIAKRRSLLMTVVMLTGDCNANCRICYTDRRRQVHELTAKEIISIMDQTAALGSRLLYIPGEGEPTLDRGFFEVLEHARSINMDVILFTNGILLSNDEESILRWGMTSEDFVRRLREYPVFIYHKLWSTDPDILGEMLSIKPSAYRYIEVKINGRTAKIPRGLNLLLKHLPLRRVGIETVVEKRNLKEIVKIIIPLVRTLGIKSYIEPIIHAGRCFGVFDLDPRIDRQTYEELAPWLSRQNCRRVGYKIVVHNNGYSSYGMALRPDQILLVSAAEALNVRDRYNLRDLYQLVHTNRALVEGRYQIRGCICEDLNLRLASVSSPGKN